MQFDWGRACGVHRSYGHAEFVSEAKRQGKNDIFIKNVCTNVNCREVAMAETVRVPLVDEDGRRIGICDVEPDGMVHAKIDNVKAIEKLRRTVLKDLIRGLSINPVRH